jgi:hypothetical protein
MLTIAVPACGDSTVGALRLRKCRQCAFVFNLATTVPQKPALLNQSLNNTTLPDDFFAAHQ